MVNRTQTLVFLLFNLTMGLFCWTRLLAQIIERLDEEGNPVISRLEKADFVKGEIIIKFSKGFLDLQELEKDAMTFDLGGRVVKDDSLRNTLQAVGSNQLRKWPPGLNPPRSFRFRVRVNR